MSYANRYPGTRPFLSAIVPLLLLAFAGCSAAPTAKDGESLKPNQGLLAFKVTSSADAVLGYVAFSSETSFGSRLAEYTLGPKGKIQISTGEKYYMIPLEAGDYMWGRLNVGHSFASLQVHNRFRVRANAITYVGNFRLIVIDDKFTLSVSDREEDVRKYIEETYPAYTKSMSFEKVIAEVRL
jgi:hypothetical protein